MFYQHFDLFFVNLLLFNKMKILIRNMVTLLTFICMTLHLYCIPRIQQKIILLHARVPGVTI